MADTKIDDTRRKPVVEDDEPDDWFDVPHSPRALFFFADPNCLGTKEYSARDVPVQTCFLIEERNADSFTVENAKMTDCYYDTKDWRVCKKEVCAARNTTWCFRQLTQSIDGGIP